MGLNVCFVIRARLSSVEENPAAVTPDPKTKLERAVEIKWLTQLGYFYQVQSSTDLQNWTNVGKPLLGDGDEISQFLPSQPGKPLFYRAEIKNLPD